MALKIRRGSNASRLTITPVEAELLYTTDTKKIYVGDGSTLGGTLVSGVDGGATVGTIPFYNTENTVSSSGNLKFNDLTNNLTVDKGSFSVVNESTARTLAAFNSHYNTGGPSSILMTKSRGSANVPLAVQNGDFIGTFAFSGYSGSGYFTTNSIAGSTSGPVAVGAPFTVNYTSKTGTGPYYVTYTIPSQTAPVVSRNYTISGNENTAYNGSYQVTASTTTSMTLQYNVDPGTWGAGTTTASADGILPGVFNLFSQTTNGNLQKTLRVFSNGQIYVGPIATDFPSIPYDSSWNGQLAITSTTVNPSQTLASAQLALRSYSNTTQGGSVNILRSRGTVVSPLGLNNGDQIYLFKFYGADSPSNITVAATISVDVDGAISANKVPTSITLATANATSGTVTNAVKIDSTQTTTFFGPTKQNNLRIINVNYVTVNATASYTLSSTTSNNILIATSTGYTATIILPASPVDGQICSFSVAQNPITLSVGGLVTVSPSFAGVATDGTSFTYVYRTSTSTWYRIG